MPDPYLFAVILTIIMAALVALLVSGGPRAACSGLVGGSGDRRTSSLSRSRWC